MVPSEVTNSSFQLIHEPLRVGHLPLVGKVLRDLRVAKVIDELVPEHPDREISTGACAEALLLAMLTGTHTLYRVADTLSSWDTELALGREIDLNKLHDDRLGRALDCMFKTGLGKINSGVLMEAIRSHELDLRILHSDTTSVKVYGDYSSLPLGFSDPENPDSAPIFTYGHSKDHRPDLKQMIFGLTTCDDGSVPLLGRVTDGNRSDNLELGFSMERIAAVLPDPAETLFVGDCKLFTGPNLSIARKHSLNFLTLLPRGLKAWENAYEQVSGGLSKTPILREEVHVKEVYTEGRYRTEDEEVRETWRGLSVPTCHTWKEEVDGKRVEKIQELRALVIHSSGLESRKRKSLQRASEKEAAALKRLGKKLAKDDFHCEKDAKLAVEGALAKSWRFHSVCYQVVEVEVPVKRKRGRPQKGETAKTKTVHRVELEFHWEQDLFAVALERESLFILVTLPGSTSSDADMLQGYKNHDRIEQVFSWLKGPMKLAPIFLERAERIAALALLYVFSLMVYALIQRRMRMVLEKENATIPGNKGRTNRPTTEVVFRLMERITCLWIETEDGRTLCMLMNMTTEHERALRLFGIDLLDREDVVAEIREPRRGDRGYAPLGDPGPRYRVIRRQPLKRRGGRRKNG